MTQLNYQVAATPSTPSMFDRSLEQRQVAGPAGGYGDTAGGVGNPGRIHTLSEFQSYPPNLVFRTYTLPKSSSSHLKGNGWKMKFPEMGPGFYFEGAIVVSGRVALQSAQCFNPPFFRWRFWRFGYFYYFYASQIRSCSKFLWFQKSSTNKMNFPECDDHSRLLSNFRSAFILGPRFCCRT